MKISNLLLLAVFISLSTFSLGQSNLKLKTIDFQVVYKQLNYEIDKKELGVKPALAFRNNLSLQLMKRYQMDYLILNRRFERDLITKDQQNFYASYLENIENQIKNFEISTNKILAARQKQIDENILLFFRKNISEMEQQEQSIIFSNQIILYKDASVEDVTQKILSYIYEHPEYADWLNTFKTADNLIEQIELLNKVPTKIFPKEDYQWAEGQLRAGK